MTLAQIFRAKHPRPRRSPRKAKRLLFEALESRLLLSADPVLLTAVALDPGPGVLAPAIGPERDPALTLDQVGFQPVPDPVGLPDEFRAIGQNYQLTLTPDEWLLALGSPDGGTAAIRIGLLGANPLAQGSGHDRLPGLTNYVEGGDPAAWTTGVPSFGRVRYDEVYAGIDLEYHGAGDALEYDWLVAPGADPGAIALQFSGSTGLSLTDAGDLVIHSAAGDFVHRAPVLYQDSGGARDSVSGGYVLRDSHTVGFAIGDYDPARTLTIDPVLGYSTYFGGSGNEGVAGVATDGDGNTYVIGTTSSTTLGGQATGTGFYGRAYVTKFNPAGQIEYTTLLGPASKFDDSGWAGSGGQAIAVGPDGLPHVVFDSAEGSTVTAATGLFTVEGDTVTAVTNLLPLPAPKRLHIAKLSGEGLPVYDAVQSEFTDGVSGTFQSLAGIAATGIAVDGAGASYVTFSAIDPTGAIPSFVTRVDPAGGIEFTRDLFVAPADIAVDAEGNIYLAASTVRADLPVTPDAFQAAKTPGDRNDLYVAKLDPTASGVLAATYLGGSSWDWAGGLALDPGHPGLVYLAGATSSPDFPLENPFQQHLNNAETGLSVKFDGFVAALDLDAMELRASTFLGGSDQNRGGPLGGNGEDVLSDIALDRAGHVYVVGQTNALDFPLANPLRSTYTPSPPIPNEPHPPVVLPLYDFVIAKLDPGLSTLEFSTYIGGSGHESGWLGLDPIVRGVAGGPGLAVDAAGTIHVAGRSHGATPSAFPPFVSTADFPVLNAAQPQFGGGTRFSNFEAPSDAVVLAIHQPGVVVGQGAQATAGQSFSGVVAEFTVPDPRASSGDFSATIDWGDGARSLGRITRPGGTGGAFQVVGTHQYEEPGAYAVRVEVSRPATGLDPQTNVNISAMPGVQFEPAIAVDPTDPDRLFAAAVDETGLKNVLAGTGGGLFVATSGDGGRTWSPRRMAVDATGAPLPAALGDPKAVFDEFGNLFLTYLGAARNNIVLAVSKDGGLTFRTAANLSPAGSPSGPTVALSVDQPSVAVGAGSVWITYADTFNGTVVAAGARVTGLDQVDPLTSFVVPGGRGGFGDISIGPSGEVLVLWEEGVNAVAAPPFSVFTSADPDGLGPAPFSDPRLLARTFTPAAPFAFMPSQGIDSEFNLAWDPEGGERGRVYVAYTEPTPAPGDPANLTDLDIYLRHSDDAGATWQAPVRVSDAPAGTFQFLPGIGIDASTGHVAVGWYDTRRDPGGIFSDFMVAVSRDRGASFSPSQRVSLDVSSAALMDPAVVGRGKGFGDYSTLAFNGGVLHPVWADNSLLLGGIPDRPQLDVATAAIGVIDVAAGRVTIQPRSVQAFEGSAFTGTVATFTYPDPTRVSGDFIAMIDWGDGTPATAGVVTGPNSPTFSVTGTHTFADTGIYPVSVSVRDPATGRDTVAVSNVSRQPSNQAEGTIAIDPTNPGRAFAAAVHLPLDGSSGILAATSEDGGATWTSRILGDGSDGLPAASGDPRAAFDRFGNLFLTYLTTAAPREQVVVLLSEDGGTTFSLLHSFSDGNDVDQPTIATGPGSGGAGGSVWVTFERDGGAASTQIIHAAGAPVSGPGAVGTFDLFRVSDATEGSRNFGDIAIGPQGQVLVSYQAIPASGPSSLVVHRDPDGLGPTGFGAATVITTTAVGAKHELPAQRVRTVDAEGNLAWDRSEGDFKGRVYFAYTDLALLGDSTDTDVFLRISEDGGATWSDRVRVNDDDTAASQFLPSLAVDQTTGALGIGWHSTQGDPANVKTGFFATTSGDGGASFARRVRLSAGDSDATNPGLDARGKEFQFGDYTGLAFESGLLEAVWGDNSAELGDNPKRPQFDLAGGRLGTARVVGAPLDVDVLPPDGVVEGKEFTDRVARFTDPQPESGVSADDYSATIAWGDGTEASAGTIVADGFGGYLVRGTHQYRHAGSYTVTVTVRGRGATPATETGTLEVEDAAVVRSPRFVRLVDDVLFEDVLPGPPFDDVVATFTDANPFGRESDFAAEIDWDNGNEEQPGLITSVIGPAGTRVFLVRGNNVYRDEGGYEVEVTIRSKDDKGDEDRDELKVISVFTVGDPALVALAPPALSALDGVPTGRILLGSFFVNGPVDSGNPDGEGVDTWEAEVEWGDGGLPEQLIPTDVQVVSLGPFPDLPNHVLARLDVFGGHTYADDGVHEATITITSDSGDSQTFSLTATVGVPLNVAVLPPVGVVEGQEFTDLVARFTDPQPESGATAADYFAAITWGDGTEASAGIIADDPAGGYLVRGTHAYQRFGQYTLSVTVGGRGASPGTAAGPLAVQDAAITTVPRFLRLVDDVPFEDTPPGPPFDDVVLTFTDANPNGEAAHFSATIDWGTGGGAQPGLIVEQSQPDGGRLFLVRGANTYHEERSFPVLVTITSVGGGSVQATSIFTVGDPPLVALDLPTLSALEGVGTGVVSLGRFLVDGPVDFGTPGTQGVDAWQAVVDWGDGSAPELLAAVEIERAGPRGSLRLTGAHTYADDGVYAGTITITSDSGDVRSFALTATVAPDLNAAGLVRAVRTGLILNPATQRFAGALTVTNATAGDIDGPFRVVFDDLPADITLANIPERTNGGDPVVRVDAVKLRPGEALPPIPLEVSNPAGLPVTYTARVFAGVPEPAALSASLLFEPNLGQTDGSVDFVSRGPNYTLFLTSSGAVLGVDDPSDTRDAAIAMHWLDGRAVPVPVGLDLQQGRSNYFTGADAAAWVTDVPSFGRVRYSAVYDGIDLEYYGRDGQLEYDWIVRPGADPTAIRMTFAGTDGLSLDGAGNLRLAVPGGELVQLAPEVYQEVGGQRVSIEGRYAIGGDGSVAFDLGPYDSARPLVIDPVLLYSTYFSGGLGFSRGAAVAVDSAGNSYVTGTTAGLEYPTGASAFQPRSADQADVLFPFGPFGRADAFVTKLDPRGRPVYSTYLSGNLDEEGLAIAVDAAGNAYVTGITRSTDFPTRAAFDTTLGYGIPEEEGYSLETDVFLAKLNPDGSDLVYSTYLGGGGGSEYPGNPLSSFFGSLTQTNPSALAVDADGAAYVVGTTRSPDFPTVNALQAEYGVPPPPSKAFVTRVDPSGSSLAFSTFLGVGGAAGVVVDPDGTIVVAGSSLAGAATLSPSIDTYRFGPRSPGIIDGGGVPLLAEDIVLARLAADGSAIRTLTYVGGSLGALPTALARDSEGNIYLGGLTRSPDFPTVRALQGTLAGLDAGADPDRVEADGFVLALDASLSGLLFSTFLGGTGRDWINDIAVDDRGNVAVVGQTNSLDLPVKAALQAALFRQDPQDPDTFTIEFDDGFIASLAPGGGALNFLTYIGGSQADHFRSVDVDHAGNLVVSGDTQSLDFPTHEAFEPAHATQGHRQILLKVAPEPPPDFNRLALINRPFTVTEGVPFDGLVASFVVTGAEQPSDFSAVIDWGDGTTSPGTIAAGVDPGILGRRQFSVLGSHVYPDVGTRDVAVTVRDREGVLAVAPATPKPGVGTDHVAYRVAVDTSALIGQSGFVSVQFNPGGAPGLPDAEVLVSNVSAPGGALGTPATRAGDSGGDLGQLLTLGATDAINRFAQPLTFGLRLEFDVRFQGEAISAPGLGQSGAAFALQLLGADGITPLLSSDPSGAVVLIQLDPDGATRSRSPLPDATGARAVGAASALGTATVANAPILLSLVPLDVVEGAQFDRVVATFTDANLVSTPAGFTARIDWGDGSPETTGTISGAQGSFEVSGAHTYQQAGSYPITVTVVDGDAEVSATSGRSVLAASDSPGFVSSSVPVSGDFNGDGALDLAVAASSGVGVLLGRGDGTFQSPVLQAGTFDPIGAGDFNRDGRLDLVVRGVEGTQLVVGLLAGNGDGTFLPLVRFSGLILPQDIAVADVNRDGNADLVYTEGGSTQNVLRVAPGRGDGTFETPAAVAIPLSIHQLYTADLNGDAAVEVILASGGLSGLPSTLSVLRNRGDGTFDGPVTVHAPAVSAGPLFLAIADFDGDGRRDIAAGDSAQLLVFDGLGNGEFAAPRQVASTGGVSIAAGDFDRNGRADLATAEVASLADPGRVRVFLNDGAGAFAPGVAYEGISNPTSLLSADFDRDGSLDLGVWGSGGVSVLSGLGDGTFASALRYRSAIPPPGPFQLDVLVRYARAGDVDADGHVDVVLVMQDGRIETALGDGTGAFQPVLHAGGVVSASIPGGGTISPIIPGGAQMVAELVDLNHDGRLDLLTARESGIAAVLGLGDGTFAINTATAYNEGPFPNAVILADFNGDGRLDIATATGAGGGGGQTPPPGHVGILLARADGTFQPMVPYTTGAVTVSVTAGDFNGDGRLDLAAANSGAGIAPSVSVLLGNGDGTFAPATTVLALDPQTFSPIVVGAGDFDNDMKADLMVGTFTGSGYVLPGNGDGTFGSALSFATPNPNQFTFWRAGQVADVNADGRLDIVIADRSSTGFANLPGVLRVFLGNGDRTFQPSVSYTAGALPAALAVGDFNADGRVDLAAADAERHKVVVLLGAPGGTFQTAVEYDPGLQPRSIATGDFNADGKLDLAVGNLGESTASILLGTGSGTFQPALNYAIRSNGAPVALAAGDLNGDQRDDLAVLGGSGGATVAFGNGDGTFPLSIYTHFDFQGAGFNFFRPVDLAVGDINGDGHVDIGVPFIGTSIRLGRGNGSFAAPVELTPPASIGFGFAPARVAFADMDGDADLDLVSVHRDFVRTSDSGVLVWRNTGTGTFGAPIAFPVPMQGNQASADLAVGDVDGDGRADVVVSDVGVPSSLPTSPPGGISVLLAIGDGGLRPAVRYVLPTTQRPYAVTLADMNGDARLDIVALVAPFATGGSTVAILSNNGDGTFGPPQSYHHGRPAASLTHMLTVADINGDGAPDIVVPHVNTASGTFYNGFGLFFSGHGPAIARDAAITVTALDLNPRAGVAFTATVATFIDANPFDALEEFTATIAWGDGQSSSGTVRALPSGGFEVSGTHTYAAIGTFATTVTVREAGAGVHADSATARVTAADQGLAALGVDITATQGIAFSGVVATFTDGDPAGSAGDFSAVIDWGDGLTSPGFVRARAGGGFEVRGVHTYQQSGSLLVRTDIADIGGSTAMAQSQATVMTPANRAPVAGDDAAVTLEDAPLTVDILANDGDPDGDPLTVALVAGPAFGTLAVNGNQTVTYTPGPDFNGLDAFTYRAHDGADASSVVTVALTVNAVNDAPTFAAGPDPIAAEDAGPQALPGWATAISPGPADEASQVTQFALLTTNPSLFAVLPALAADGTLTYAAAADASGVAVVVAQLADDGGVAGGGVDTSGFQAFTIRILPVNDAPEATADAYAALGNATLRVPGRFGVLGNDADADADALTAVLHAGPAHGTLSLDADGAFTYVPAPDFSGSDGFIYAASDGLVDSPPVSVSIAVLPVNVAPVIAAIPDMLIAEGGAIDHAGSFSDANPGDSWTATADYGDGSGPRPLDLAPGGGEPATAFALHHTYRESGEYQATVRVVDQDGRIGTASFSVTVLNLPPAVEAGPDREASEGVRVHVAATFSDPGAADTHTATIDWGDGTGARLLEVDELDGTGTARAAHAYADEGVYTVTIAVTDDEGATASDGFTVTVTNAAPFVDGGPGRTVDEGEIISLPALIPFDLSGPGVNRLSGSYADQGALDNHTATVNWGDGTEEPAPALGRQFGPLGAPSGVTGVAESAHRYGDDGVYIVVLTVVDSDGGSGSDSFAVTVLNVSPAVEAGPDQEAEIGSGVALAAIFSDPGVLDTHTATIDWGDGVIEAGLIQAGVADGVRSGAVSGSHVYASSGSFTVSVAVTDDDGGMALDTLVVGVSGPSGGVAPVAGDDPRETDEDAALTIDVLANDADPDGTIDPSTVAIAAAPGHGSVLVDPLTGAVTYTPEADFAGLDEFRYTVKDNEGLTSNAALVSVVVNPLNDPPELMDIGDRTLVEGQTLNVTGSFADADPGDVWTATVDWGDGGGAEPLALMGTTFQLSHRYADAGAYTLTVTVVDGGGSVASNTALIDVANAVPALADLAATPEVDEGGLVSLTGSVGNPGGDQLTLAVDWGDGASETVALPVGAESFALSHRYLDDAPSGTLADVHAIQVRLLDDDGSEIEGLAGTVVKNVAPAAALGAPAAGVAGVPVSFTGTFTDPGVLDAHKVAWDFGDGTALAERPAADPGALTPTHTYAGEGVFTATLIVRDDDGGVATVESLISIAARELNTAPVAQLAGPAGGVRGQRLSFAGMFTDPDLLDTHEVAVDWGDGTGIAFHPSTDPGALGPTHVYTEAKGYTVTWTVRDGAGAMGSASLPVTIQAVALQPDPVDPAKTALVVGGTNGNDEIKFITDKASGGVKLQINRVTLGPFVPTGRLVAYGLAGDDDIIVAAGIALPAELYGGPGQDTLKAGKGSAILVGGPGIDQLVAGTAADLLIGGEGVDRLAGAGDGDILIGGATAYDDDPAALRAVMAEWTRNDLSYAERVEHLMNGGGRNGLVRLDAAAVSGDGRTDQVTGGRGLDWFLASVGDRVTGRKAPEILAPEGPPRTFAIAWSLSAVDRATAEVPNRRVAAPGMPEFAIEDEGDGNGDLGEKALLGEVPLQAAL